MNYPDPLFPSELLWAANAIALLALAYALKFANWRLLAKPEKLNLWLGIIVVLMLIWSVKTGIKPGLNFHLLGATLLTLMFGLPLALLALALILLAVTAYGMAGWAALGLNFLVMAAVPALFSRQLFTWADTKLPNNVFVFTLFSGFFCAGAAMLLTGVVSNTVLALAEAYSRDYLASNYLPYFILMSWSEALLTGMACTLMAVYRPEWLVAFDDRRYLKPIQLDIQRDHRNHPPE